MGIMKGAGYILDQLIRIDKKKYYENYPIKIKDGRIFYGNLKNIRYRSLFWHKVHERVESELLSLLLREDDVFFDIGANIGWYTTLAAQILKNGKVYAFEPIDEVANAIHFNSNNNGLTNILVEKIALADFNGATNINFNKENWGLSSLKVDNAGEEKISITVKRLDDFVRENKIEKITFIKCDIEGAEYLFLKGAILSLKKFSPVILMEISASNLSAFKNTPIDIYKLLIGLGYKMFSIYPLKGKISLEEYLPTNNVEQQNIIAFSTENKNLLKRLNTV